MEIMEHTTLLVSAIFVEEEVEQFDTRFDPFYFTGQDQGLYYPNEEIDEYLYFVIEACDEKWGTDWKGCSIQHWLILTDADPKFVPPEGYKEQIKYYKK